MVTCAGAFSVGWSLYVKDGKPVFLSDGSFCHCRLQWPRTEDQRAGDDAVQREDHHRAWARAIRLKRRRTMMRPRMSRPLTVRPLPPAWPRQGYLNASVATGSKECWARAGSAWCIWPRTTS